MLINDKNPQHVLKPDFLEQYKDLHQDIWHRLIQINTNISILEILQKFPFRHIYYPPENIFWESVYWNFLYTSIILIHALVSDTGKDAHTLTKFKNTVHNWLQDSEKQEYATLLKGLDFETSTKKIRNKIARMRTDLLAHRLLDENQKLKNVDGVTVSEIRRLYDVTEELFRRCSFGCEYVTTFYPRGTCGGKPIAKDIDHILDLIAKDSTWVNQPERSGAFWKDLRQYKSEEYLKELTTWRQKFGLPPA
jgi:hypothetical protein